MNLDENVIPLPKPIFPLRYIRHRILEIMPNAAGTIGCRYATLFHIFKNSSRKLGYHQTIYENCVLICIHSLIHKSFLKITFQYIRHLASNTYSEEFHHRITLVPHSRKVRRNDLDNLLQRYPTRLNGLTVLLHQKPLGYHHSHFHD